MYHSINSGRLRHYVELYRPSANTDEYGQSLGDVFVFDMWANCQVVSGNKLVAYGSGMTSSVITVLAWYDERATNSMILVWEGERYQVNHIKPDEGGKAMILTCEVIAK